MSSLVGEWINYDVFRQWNIIQAKKKLLRHENMWRKLNFILLNLKNQSEKSTYYMIL